MCTKNIELGLGEVEFFARFFNGELVRFQLSFRNISFGRQFLTVFQIFLGTPEVFLGHKLSTFQLFFFFPVGTGEVFLEGKFGRLHICLGFNQGCICLMDRNSLFQQIFLQTGIIQFNQEISFFYHRAFGNDF